MKIYTLEDIRRAADIASAYVGINWDILDSEPKAVTYFTRSLEYGANRVATLEKVYKERVLAHVDMDTGELDTTAAMLTLEQADILAEELHASYSMAGILHTFRAIQEITGGQEPKPRRKRPSRKRRKNPPTDPEADS